MMECTSAPDSNMEMRWRRPHVLPSSVSHSAFYCFCSVLLFLQCYIVHSVVHFELSLVVHSTFLCFIFSFLIEIQAVYILLASSSSFPSSSPSFPCFSHISHSSFLSFFFVLIFVLAISKKSGFWVRTEKNCHIACMLWKSCYTFFCNIFFESNFALL